MLDDIKIFVYGSCHSSETIDNKEMQSSGGYGVVINVNGKRTDELSAGYANTTNARMDIMGITEGLKRILNPAHVTVYLTNGYIIDTLTKGWLESWKKQSFVTMKHMDLWLELDKILSYKLLQLSFKHSRDVRYHADFKYAEQLGKTMSGQKNLRSDLQIQSKNTPNLFENDLDTSQSDVIENHKPSLESICVDASSIGNPGPTEYRGMDTAKGKVLFSMQYEEATNNIGEFLAIVHALALIKQDKLDVKIIYSDSLNAISWVKQKKCKTKYEATTQNSRLFGHISRAVQWLKDNPFETKILKWDTVSWGQIPADYGRK